MDTQATDTHEQALLKAVNDLCDRWDEVAGMYTAHYDNPADRLKDIFGAAVSKDRKGRAQEKIDGLTKTIRTISAKADRNWHEAVTRQHIIASLDLGRIRRLLTDMSDMLATAEAFQARLAAEAIEQAERDSIWCSE